MPEDVPTTSRYSGLDLFVGAGPSAESCAAAIDGVLGLGDAQFVDGEDPGALIAAIERTTIGWVVCRRSDHPEYPHQFDISMIDGRLPIEAVPDIVRRLGVTIVVPDNRNDDPYAGLRFDPDGTTRPFSLLVFDH